MVMMVVMVVMVMVMVVMVMMVVMMVMVVVTTLSRMYSSSPVESCLWQIVHVKHRRWNTWP